LVVDDYAFYFLDYALGLHFEENQIIFLFRERGVKEDFGEFVLGD
jgi:hypothetical protein